MKRKKFLPLLLILPLLMSNSPAPNQGFSDYGEYEITSSDYVREDNKVTFSIENDSKYYAFYSSEHFSLGDKEYFLPPQSKITLTLELKEYMLRVDEPLTFSYYAFDYKEAKVEISDIDISNPIYNLDDDETTFDISIKVTNNETDKLYGTLFYFYDENAEYYRYGWIYPNYPSYNNSLTIIDEVTFHGEQTQLKANQISYAVEKMHDYYNHENERFRAYVLAFGWPFFLAIFLIILVVILIIILRKLRKVKKV